MPPQFCLRIFFQPNEAISKLTMQLRMYPMLSIRLQLISSGQSLEIALAKCRQRENWQQEPVPKCDNSAQHWAMMNPSSRNIS